MKKVLNNRVGEVALRSLYNATSPAIGQRTFSTGKKPTNLINEAGFHAFTAISPYAPPLLPLSVERKLSWSEQVRTSQIAKPAPEDQARVTHANDQSSIAQALRPRLEPGNTIITVIAPSRPGTQEEIEKIQEYAKSLGAGVVFQEQLTASIIPAERTKHILYEFNKIATINEKAPNVRNIIWAIGGDYGSEQVVQYLHENNITLPKIDATIVGFSGFTPFLNEVARQGTCTEGIIHGAMIGDIATSRCKTEGITAVATTKKRTVSTENQESIEKLLESTSPTISFSSGLKPGNRIAEEEGKIIRGKIHGGNLGAISTGTCSWRPLDAFEGKIALIEQVDERHNILRMVRSMVQGGFFDKSNAVLIGNMSLRDLSEDPTTAQKEKKEFTDNLLKEFAPLEAKGIPVIYGLPVGHNRYAQAIPLASHTEITLGKQPKVECEIAPKISEKSITPPATWSNRILSALSLYGKHGIGN